MLRFLRTIRIKLRSRSHRARSHRASHRTWSQSQVYTYEGLVYIMCVPCGHPSGAYNNIYVARAGGKLDSSLTPLRVLARRHKRATR